MKISAVSQSSRRRRFAALTLAGGLLVVQQSGLADVKLSAQSSVPPVAAAPVAVGTAIAGTFADATGHSGQSHLIYAANAGVWWLFTLTSSGDSHQGGTNHIIKAYRSSGANLATATWTAAPDSPGAASAASANCGLCFMGGGRALGVAYVNNRPSDVVHAEVAMAADGGNGLTGHIRAVVTATTIAWESWNYHDEPAATWTLPRAVTLGVSTGKYIHSAGPILQQEVDANARRSANADTSGTWASGFSSVSVIDNSMIHQNNALAFAPLANNAMLAVYDNGGGISTCYNCGQTGIAEPNLSNLGYKKSNADGSWPGVSVATQAGGDGQVFPTDATINQNDWTIVALDTTSIQAFRSNAAGTGIDAAAYNAATNTWTSFPAPPPFGSGQSLERGSGVFGARADSSIWLFVINTDAANSILYTTYRAGAWTAWATVPGTGSGQHDRSFISGSPTAGNNQIGLIWTEGTGPYDVVVTSIDVTAPAVSMVAPADGSTLFGSVSVEASVSDNAGITGVQFQIDDADQGPVQNAPPYGMTWDSTTVTDGSHAIGAIAADGAGNISSARITVTVSNNPLATVPNVVNQTQAAATDAITAAGLVVGTVTTSSSASVPNGSVISSSPAAGTQVLPGSAVNLVVSTGPTLVAVPNVVNQTQAAATTAISGAGLVVGAVTNASSATVPSGSVIGQSPAGGTQVASGSAVNLTVSTGPPAAGPTVDIVVFSDGTGTRTTPAFNTSAAGDVLVAFAASDGPPTAPQTLTISGAGLTWTLVRRANTRAGTSEIWRAIAAAQLANVTVKSTQSKTGYGQSLTVVAFRGATGIGASAIANGASGAPTVSLVTTRASSLVYGVGNDWDRAVARTLGSGQAMAHQRIDTASGDTYWVQSRSQAVPTAGTSIQLNDTAPTGDRWNFASVEIVR